MMVWVRGSEKDCRVQGSRCFGRGECRNCGTRESIRLGGVDLYIRSR